MIERIPEARLGPGDEAEIAALIETCFTASDFGGRSFYQNRPHLRVVARNGARIVGHMGLFLRAVRLEDALVDVAGIGDVAVHPDARGRRLATAMLEAAVEEARAGPAAFLLLFGTRRLYAAAGFEKAPNRVTVTQMERVRTGPVETWEAQALMVKPLRDVAWDPAAPVDLLGFPF